MKSICIYFLYLYIYICYIVYIYEYFIVFVYDIVCVALCPAIPGADPNPGRAQGFSPHRPQSARSPGVPTGGRAAAPRALLDRCPQNC